MRTECNAKTFSFHSRQIVARRVFQDRDHRSKRSFAFSSVPTVHWLRALVFAFSDRKTLETW